MEVVVSMYASVQIDISGVRIMDSIRCDSR